MDISKTREQLDVQPNDLLHDLAFEDYEASQQALEKMGDCTGAVEAHFDDPNFTHFRRNFIANLRHNHCLSDSEIAKAMGVPLADVEADLKWLCVDALFPADGPHPTCMEDTRTE